MSEYEKSLFRVYERCVSSLGSAQGQRTCLGLRHCCFGLAALGACLVAVLHVAYVGNAGCLVAQLEAQLPPLPHSSSSSSNSTVDSGSGSSGSSGGGNSSAAALAANGSTALGARLPDSALLFVHLERTTGPEPLFGSWVSVEEERRRRRRLGVVAAGSSGGGGGGGGGSSSSHNRATASAPPPPLTAASADYVFAVKPLVLAARQSDPAFLAAHSFGELHVRLPAGGVCFGGGLPRALLEYVAGFDTAVINQLMWGLRSDGTVLNLRTGESWNWFRAQLAERARRSIGEAAVSKLVAVAAVCFAYFVTSSATALVVRVLISSGVAMMWPAFKLLEVCGLRANTAVLSQSYPWVGRAVESLELRGESSSPLLSAHLAQTLVFYLLYQGCHMAWRVWFYNKSQPSGVLLWLWSLVMLSEYFAMLFVRAEASARFFPEAVFGAFAAWHAYFYSYVYAYFFGVLGVAWCFTVGSMCVVAGAFETEALAAGAVSAARPRCVATELGWPAWSAELPQLFTVFMCPSASPPHSFDARLGHAAARAREAQEGGGHGGGGGAEGGALAAAAGRDGGGDGGDGGGGGGAGAGDGGGVLDDGSPQDGEAAQRDVELRDAAGREHELRVTLGREEGGARHGGDGDGGSDEGDEDEVELQVRGGGGGGHGDAGGRAQTARWRARQRNLDGGAQYTPAAGAEPDLLL